MPIPQLFPKQISRTFSRVHNLLDTILNHVERLLLVCHLVRVLPTLLNEGLVESEFLGGSLLHTFLDAVFRDEEEYNDLILVLWAWTTS